MSHGREYTLDEMWENFKYFIRAVVPIAEQNHVRIGIHPDYPPVRQKLAGVPRIFSHFDGYKRALEIAKVQTSVFAFALARGWKAAISLGRIL